MRQTRRQQIAYQECRSLHSCNCTLCTRQSSHTIQIKPSFRLPPSPISAFKKDFFWLLQTLGKANSLTVNIPQTVFYTSGKPSFLFSSKQGKIKLVTSQQRLQPNELIKTFTTIVRSRKKEQRSIKPQIYIFTQADYKPQNYGKQIALLRYQSENLRIMSQTEFFNLMTSRPGNLVWKTLQYLQTVIKSKTGINECSQINFDPSVENSCKAIFQVLLELDWKLCSMRAQIQTDDDGVQWLIHADKIKVQKLQPKPEFKMPPLRMHAESREKLENSIALHQLKKSPRVRILTQLMTKNYLKVREATQIQKVIDNEFKVVVPQKYLPFRVDERFKKMNRTAESDPRNTTRTVKRMLFFQSKGFKNSNFSATPRYNRILY